jgi:phosphatidylglycerophosphatase A
LAFALFRIFDITKPWPIRKLEGLHGGTGIIADDLLAGVYGAVVMAAAAHFRLI